MFDDLEIKKEEEKRGDNTNLGDSPVENNNAVPQDIFSEIETVDSGNAQNSQVQVESLSVNNGKEKPEVFKRKVEPLSKLPEETGHKKIILISVFSFFIVAGLIGVYLFLSSEVSVDVVPIVEKEINLEEASTKEFNDSMENSGEIEPPASIVIQ